MIPFDPKHSYLQQEDKYTRWDKQDTHIKQQLETKIDHQIFILGNRWLYIRIVAKTMVLKTMFLQPWFCNTMSWEKIDWLDPPLLGLVEPLSSIITHAKVLEAPSKTKHMCRGEEALDSILRVNSLSLRSLPIATLLPSGRVDYIHLHQSIFFIIVFTKWV